MGILHDGKKKLPELSGLGESKIAIACVATGIAIGGDGMRIDTGYWMLDTGWWILN
jgi:hypothetical protein